MTWYKLCSHILQGCVKQHKWSLPLYLLCETAQVVTTPLPIV